MIILLSRTILVATVDSLNVPAVRDERDPGMGRDDRQQEHSNDRSRDGRKRKTTIRGLHDADNRQG